MHLKTVCIRNRGLCKTACSSFVSLYPPATKLRTGWGWGGMILESLGPCVRTMPPDSLHLLYDVHHRQTKCHAERLMC